MHDILEIVIFMTYYLINDDSCVKRRMVNSENVAITATIIFTGKINPNGKKE